MQHYLQTVLSDDQAKMGKFRDPAPRWLGNILAWFLNLVRPRNLIALQELLFNSTTAPCKLQSSM
jgi:hypothetical protein